MEARDPEATLVIGPHVVQGTGRLTILRDPRDALFALFAYDSAHP